MRTIECASRFYTFWRTSHLDSHLRRFLGLGFSKNLSWLWSPLQLAIDSQIGRHEHWLSTGETSVRQVVTTGFQHRDNMTASSFLFCKRTKIPTLLISIKVYFSSILDFLVTSLVMWIWPLRLQREHWCFLRVVGFLYWLHTLTKEKRLPALFCSMAI